MAEKTIICIDDYEKWAEENLPKGIWHYYSGGANDETTLRDNVQAFKRYRS